MIRDLALLALGAALINNLVFVQFLGISPALNMSKNVKSAAQMGVAVIFVLFFASLLTWVVNTYFLAYFRLEILENVAFILIIVAFVQFCEMLTRKKFKSLYPIFGRYLPFIMANCAILGIVLMNSEQFGVLRENFLHNIINSLAAGIGFFIAIMLLAGVRERLELKNIPKAFRGIPIALISAALIALAFIGFTAA